MEDGTIGSNEITVKPPILGLVPIPALLIETVDVDFTMEIKTVSEDKSSTNVEVSTDAEAGTGSLNPFYSASIKVHGAVSAQRENTRSTDKTAKYDVRVHAAQQPQTEGMAKLMDLLASTVEPIESKTRKAAK